MKDQNRLNLSGINTVTAAITDYQVISEKLARVVVAYSGRQTRDDLIENLASQLKYNATPVEGSFRQLTANSMVGYVRANQELRPTTEQEVRAAYRVVASSDSGNILMSNDDNTLWEVRTGSSGMFLARKGQEDLGALVESATNRRHGVPRLSQVVSAGVAQAREFVAFASDAGDMDYGFCVAASKDGQRLKVVSSTSGRAEVIKSAQVASVLPAKAMSIPRDAHNRVVASGINRDQVNQQVEYYSRLYSYAPDYLADVIRQVEETAAM